MALFLTFTITVALLGLYIFYYKTTVQIPKKESRNSIFFLLIAGFVIRLFLAYYYKGHETDMECFNIWSDMLKTNGFSSFYTSDAFTDYPPGYMYVLYLLGFIKDIFGAGSKITYAILKLPGIVADILTGFCIYKLCKNHRETNLKYLLTGFYIFNPVTILNSSIWGQVDSVFTLFIVLMLYALTEKKLICSYFLFAIAVLIKPQALFYFPVLIFGIIENVFLHKVSIKNFLVNLISGLCAIAVLCLLMLPFGFTNVVNQYMNTIGSYDYAAVNAYNLWTGLGKNWGSLSFGMTLFSAVSIIMAVLACIYIFFYKKEENRYFITAAFICFSIFTLSVKMHERYAFPVMVLLLCSYALSSKKKDMYLYLGISTLQFLNIFHVLFFYDPATAFDKSFYGFAIIVSWLTVFSFIFFAYLQFKGILQTSDVGTVPRNNTKITKKDLIIVSAITLIYSSIALFNLGDTKAPQSFETINEDSYLKINLKEETDISKINLYIGAENVDESDMLIISMFDRNGILTYEQEIEEGSVFRWEEFENLNASVKNIEISSVDTVYIGEIGIFDKTGNQIFPANSNKVTDEQDVVPYKSSYRNSTYFDEIYHARTAYEFIHELPIYEWTHPPLGKSLISIGVNTFGMTPFGWRIVGTLFGIMMVPVLYIFSKKMFGETWISTLSAIVFSFDFMHFTQTRIATIDVYVTFFIMLMYLFMYKYCDNLLNEKSNNHSLIPLAFSGLFMGLGIASKWTGVYAGLGLAVIFFASIILIKRSNGINTKYIYKTFGFCLISFVLVPILIYLLSYIPFLKSNNGGFYDILKNQEAMLTYHGKTVVSSKHFFSSKWYEWVIDYRPIWYYTGTNGNLTENISAFGNPLVWISGLFAFMYCVYDSIRYRNKNAIFLVISYLAQLLPWVFVERTTFIYHYFPCVPFLVLMIAHFIHRIYHKNKYTKIAYITFTVATVLLFIMFYPSISGFPVDENYVKDFLIWMPSWHLIN